MQISILAAVIAASSFVAALPTGTSCDTPTATTTTTPTASCKPGHFKKHKVKSGETLTTIAERYNSGICDIAWLNKLENPNVIDLGQLLLVPTKLCNPDNESCLTSPGTGTCVPNGEPTYTIKSGDTFFVLGQRFGITTESIIAANPGVKPESLEIGQVINIPVCKSSPGTCVPNGEPTYTIKSGDTFFALGQQFNITTEAIMGANPGVKPESLQIGQVINIPVCKASQN
nr:Intracellular hyphae protein 1-like protein 2 [Colletotrichum truncatum]KAF6780530.1 Intracellular hyphae protein 1-like protein 2 [Colletotrichum truncatum]